MIRPEILSLCAGAGLAALGYERFFHTVLAADNWWWAYLSHLANFPQTPMLWADVVHPDTVRYVCERLGNVRGIIASHFFCF